jgi:hypothetical protein
MGVYYLVVLLREDMISFPRGRKFNCEIVASDVRTPNGNPGHKYGAQFMSLKEVKTAYGTFHICLDCWQDYHQQENHREST